MSKLHAIYMRVGTIRHDTASQELQLKRWAESHEGDSCWYHDTYTGTSIDRPGFHQLIREVEIGLVTDWPLQTRVSFSDFPMRWRNSTAPRHRHEDDTRPRARL